MCYAVCMIQSYREQQRVHMSSACELIVDFFINLIFINFMFVMH